MSAARWQEIQLVCFPKSISTSHFSSLDRGRQQDFEGPMSDDMHSLLFNSFLQVHLQQKH